MIFRKKPVEIEAVLYLGNGNLGEGVPEWIWDALDDKTLKEDGDDMLIHTLEGDMKVSPNDWIIQGVQGELYPCKPDIFEATYEPISE